ncbi:MAG TPA: error-prone DNA polymerase [Flavipsychrobacter sp.]|nr:error-prone DNA polymerase [Flavipsychrobacter sp.]
MSYTELQVTTNFSFLRGGSHPEELVEQAIALGYKEIAITDHNSLAGIVRAYSAAKGKDFRIIPACRLDLLDGTSLLAYPTNRDAYSRLSSLLSKGNLKAEKGECHLHKQDVYEYAKGMKFIAIAPNSLNEHFELDESFKNNLREYKQQLGNHLYLAATRSYLSNDTKRLYRLAQLSEKLHIPLVATNNVHYHNFERRELQDVLTCIREKCTIYKAGYRLYQNAERYLKPIGEMQRLFRQYPEAVERTQEITQACQFSLHELQYVYPEEVTTEGRTPQEELTYLTWKKAREFYGEELPEKVAYNIHYELKFIEEMNYAAYFLTVYDIVKFANDNHILCQGRGSAANSTICFCLGITAVDPTQFDLLFERFISSARNEPPDIDVDFEHERREEVMQYIYNKYGRDRAAIVATVTQVHKKGAVRDVAKVMGMSADAINRLSNSLWEFDELWLQGKRISEQGFNPNDPHLIKILELTDQYRGFPRQLGQHTGGFVITQGKLHELCPVLNARMENRTCIEWNKDDIDTLGFLKIDVLALGMLTCIRKAFDLLKAHYGKEYALATVPKEDRKVYEMISHADTLGVFQIESRAQMSMLPRLKPKCFYDLVIEVAIVRPGPIQGDMVHPYLKRRENPDEVEYPSEELRDILKKTLGVPLFQEQAMKIAIVAAKFSPAEADELRRSMATFKAKGVVSKFERKLIDGMVSNGYTQEFAARVFRQLEGFGSYGFPESHAASFALLVYVSSWIKYYYPDVFAAALLNSMPMGFYQPAQIIIDARKHGVTVREVDINHSDWNNTLEEKVNAYCALRLGFRQVKGLNEEEMQVLATNRTQPYTTINELLNVGISIKALEQLADADAFRSIKLDRRQALWQVAALMDNPTGMYKGQSAAMLTETNIALPSMSLSEHVIQDYAATGLSIKAHPVSFVRNKLSMLNIIPTSDLAKRKDGDSIEVAGLVLVRQRPGTATGVCFITIEDETGIANLVVFRHLFEKFRKEILSSRLLKVTGKLQIEGEVIHVVIQSCCNFNKLLSRLGQSQDDNSLLTLCRAEEKEDHPGARQNQKPKVVQAEIFPGGRNFR